jgi:hypothetical protein
MGCTPRAETPSRYANKKALAASESLSIIEEPGYAAEVADVSVAAAATG